MNAPLAEILDLLRSGRTEEAHERVQADGSPEAAYLHGMIHRDEGDLANARYWFSHAGDVPRRLGFDPMDVDRDVEGAALARLLKP